MNNSLSTLAKAHGYKRWISIQMQASGVNKPFCFFPIFWRQAKGEFPLEKWRLAERCNNIWIRCGSTLYNSKLVLCHFLSFVRLLGISEYPRKGWHVLGCKLLESIGYLKLTSLIYFVNDKSLHALSFLDSVPIWSRTCIVCACTIHKFVTLRFILQPLLSSCHPHVHNPKLRVSNNL